MIKWIWGIGGMIVTGENGGDGRKPCFCAILSFANTTWAGLGPKAGRRGERSAIYLQTYDTAFQKFVINHQTVRYLNPQSYNGILMTFDLEL